VLDRLLKNALEGFTVVEETVGSTSGLLAKQLAGYARASGKRVASVSLTLWDQSLKREAMRIPVNPASVSMSEPGGQERTHDSGIPFLDVGNYDVLVVEGLSSFLLDKTSKEANEVIRHIGQIARQGRSFIVTFDPSLLEESTAGYLRAAADTVIVVKTELFGEKVNRSLYVPKLRASKPMDKLIKITVDELGVQVDTREFVG